MTFRSIRFGSTDYAEELALREAVLRAPLGLTLYHEDLSAEAHQHHFGLFDPGESRNDENRAGEPREKLAACVIAVIHPDGHAKIRQMAVADSHQRQGLGTRIMRALENHLAEHDGITRVQLHARMTAFHFYRKLGYTPVGAEFIEIGIPHILMERPLPPVS